MPIAKPPINSLYFNYLFVFQEQCMNQLENLRNFVRIVECSGIGRAAEQIGIAKSVVSRRLAELESQYGVRLINRTTRKLSLTEAGQTCYQHALGILGAMGEMESQIRNQHQQLKGRLNVALPLDFALEKMLGAVNEFKQQHPELALNLDLSDHVVDVVETGVDLAIRISGQLPDSSLQARTLASGKLILIASPDYLKRYGTPNSLEDLNAHCFILYPSSGLSQLTLQDQKGQQIQVPVSNDIVVNSGRFIKELCMLGRGIAFEPEFICQKAIEQGELVRVLPQYSSPIGHVHAVYAQNKFVPVKVRVFIDFLVDWFEKHPV